jgi:hypothetical protein
MAMAFKEFFVSERAKALAQVLVTRRDDLSIQEIKDDGEFDFWLNIRRQNSYNRCQIGLVIKAAMTLGSSDQTNEQLKAAAQRVFKLGSCNFPVVLFYFTAKDDRGYYAWIWEPEIDKAGVPRLRFQSSPSFRDLDDKSLDEIVNTAKRWCDVLHATLTNEQAAN